MQKKLLVIMAATSLLILILGASVMGLFDFMKVCLFSEVNGVVLIEGKPVAGAEVVRTSKMNDSIYTDKTVTDKQGRYHFDARYARSVDKILPVQPMVEQNMTITYENKAHLGWETTKMNFKENGELNKIINVSCDLSSQPEIRTGPRYNPIKGICTGEGIVKEMKIK